MPARPSAVPSGAGCRRGRRRRRRTAGRRPRAPRRTTLRRVGGRVRRATARSVTIDSVAATTSRTAGRGASARETSPPPVCRSSAARAARAGRRAVPSSPTGSLLRGPSVEPGEVPALDRHGAALGEELLEGSGGDHRGQPRRSPRAAASRFAGRRHWGRAQSLYEPQHDEFRDMVRAWAGRNVAPFHEQWEKDGIVTARSGSPPARRACSVRSRGVRRWRGPRLPLQRRHRRGDDPGRRQRRRLRAAQRRRRPLSARPGHRGAEAALAARLLRGELITAIAMTEPGAGSDLQGVRTGAGDGER